MSEPDPTNPAPDLPGVSVWDRLDTYGPGWGE